METHLNPSKKEFSCWSSTYKSHSRIDYFLVSAELLSNIKGCQYNSKLILDHAAVSIEYVEVKLISKCPWWKFLIKWMWDKKKFCNLWENKLIFTLRLTHPRQWPPLDKMPLKHLLEVKLSATQVGKQNKHGK